MGAVRKPEGFSATGVQAHSSRFTHEAIEIAAPTALNAVEAWLRVESEHMTRQAVEELRAEVAWLKGRALAEPPLRKVP